MSIDIPVRLIEQGLSVLEKLQRRTEETDKMFESCKGAAGRLMEDFLNDPFREDLIDRSRVITDRFDQIQYNQNRQNDFEVARTASAVVAGRVRRTHFAAYVAGQYRNDNRIGFKYKNWMHNAAAFGAISLHQCIDDILETLETNNQLAKQTISMFSFAAREDAKVFLDAAEQIDPRSCLTQFNRATLDILSQNPNYIRHGIDTILRIEAPGSDAHFADLKWHIDNFSSFDNANSRIREIIKIHFEHEVEPIENHLQRNLSRARNIMESRAEASDSSERSYNRLAIVGMSVGTVVSAIVYSNPELASLLQELLEVTMSVVDISHPEEGQISALGDGGLPFSSRIAAAAFGDGGLPFSIQKV